ncbi:xylosidase : arabinofuranosidase [Aspergillus clavatus NRRL 1]|uniref:Xylosidase: arabinofuranosidase n=1 Tax=Aspergillus clavatus (strain ATCC 1007 / CBS 513.65 / DSM 816 / NCTC 3887 / NRRL 1 / QM 1276 / 107) TaxID=344612 RepID=A1C6Z6_ASPCL|nr:xylosidase : arabinofuranosidase [Aspergillus clavatus NRRL 1]EAW14167.1 xylosidase : arabinofuranosidase [Aspergillus clavatus NRRL 1]
MASLGFSHPTPPQPYTNPLFPSWHSDLTCVYVPEQDTFFCATSTLVAFPGLPVYAGKDLQNWKLASNVFNRPSQIPDLRITDGQQSGIYAPTHRYHDGIFYLIVSYLGPQTKSLLFTLSDPFSGAAWCEPLVFSVRGIDPELFWDDDGTVYVTSADDQQIQQCSLDLRTGETGLMVGHADLFYDDGDGHWWAVALSTRSGPEWKNYPMGREMVLAAATGDEGEWPVVQPVHGQMQSPLPRPNRGIRRGDAAWINEPDEIDFLTGSSIPPHLVYWRHLKPEDFTVSPAGHPRTLRLTPPFYNPTGTEDFQPDDGLTLIIRHQTDTLCAYSVIVSFNPRVADKEAGVTVFLTQQHIDLGVVLLQSSKGLSLAFWFRVEGRGNYRDATPENTVPVPEDWQGGPIRLEIQTVNDSEYVFAAAPARHPKQRMVIGCADALIVSGDTGRFTGSLVGAYATKNGGSDSTPAYISRWRYEGRGRRVDSDRVIPS